MTDNTTINYTDSMVIDMMDRYIANPNLDTAKAIAEDTGTSTESVVAKLISLGIYEKVVQKAQLVKIIEAHYGIDMPSLIKATKIDLQNLVDRL